MLKVLASHFGLESTGYGRAFRSKDEIFRSVAINLNRSKCPINAERVNDGRGFNCPTGNVAMRLSSVHALRKYTLCSSKSPNMQLRAPYPSKHRGQQALFCTDCIMDPIKAISSAKREIQYGERICEVVETLVLCRKVRIGS